VPLFREASPDIEVWTGSQAAGNAGWVDKEVVDFERNLLIEVAFVASENVLFVLSSSVQSVNFSVWDACLVA